MKIKYLRSLKNNLNLIDMVRRNCCAVIRQMIEKIPPEKTELIKDLEWNYEDASYKAPEETIQWYRTMETITKHFAPKPVEEWEFEMLSIWTDLPIEQVKKMAEEEE